VVVSPDDIRKTFVHISDSQRGGILSWLGLPMVNRGGTIGALSLFSSKADAFSDQVRKLIGFDVLYIYASWTAKAGWAR
jgi:GAF domain-containing protein